MSFNPEKWLNAHQGLSNQSKPKLNNESDKTPSESRLRVESIIKQLINSKTDITAEYNEWIKLGFAFADEFGEDGRLLFHQVSCIYPEYNQKDCDKQYNSCLNSKGQGISIGTFFHFAQNSGILIPKTSDDFNEPELPHIPDVVFSKLPEFLQEIIQHFNSAQDRDVVLLGSIAVISGCLQKVVGHYAQKKVWSNIYLFVTGMASAGKGTLGFSKLIGQSVHDNFLREAKLLKSQYQIEIETFNKQKKNQPDLIKPDNPPNKMLFIPANNSTTGVFQLLNENMGRGIIFETEGDTLSQAFKTDYGNYSDGFRKAFHHETISYFRRTEREHIEINYPCISTVLSGTPKQILSLTPDAENGLFSRFAFYRIGLEVNWKNPFTKNNNENLEDVFNKLGADFFEFYKVINFGHQYVVELSDSQAERFHDFFSAEQDKYVKLNGLDFIASIRRFGIICFRLCMIFTGLRLKETGDIASQKLVCENDDFDNALAIVSVLIKHTSFVFNSLPKTPNTNVGALNKKELFLEALPQKFDTKKWTQIAIELGIPAKTAEGYITLFTKNGLISRITKGHYQKPN